MYLCTYKCIIILKHKNEIGKHVYKYKNVELKENIFKHTKVLDKKILLIHKFRGRRKNTKL